MRAKVRNFTLKVLSVKEVENKNGIPQQDITFEKEDTGRTAAVYYDETLWMTRRGMVEIQEIAKRFICQPLTSRTLSLMENAVNDALYRLRSSGDLHPGFPGKDSAGYVAACPLFEYY